MNNFENFEKAKKLLTTKKGLESFFDKWTHATQKPRIDKFKNGFCIDSRFSVFKAQVSFDCHTGEYGSSSCYTFRNGIDSSIASDLFKKAIELKKHEIFQLMSELANEEAMKIKSECEAELKEASKKLEEIQEL